MLKTCSKHKQEKDIKLFNNCKDGRDISEEIKNKILGQDLNCGRLSVENKEESKHE